MILDEINAISMKIILHSGNAKDHAYQALNKLESGNTSSVNECIDLAKIEVNLAHKEQTKLIQYSMDHTVEYSVLFTHAQDILMVTMTELNLIERFIKYQEREKK